MLVISLSGNIRAQDYGLKIAPSIDSSNLAQQTEETEKGRFTLRSVHEMEIISLLERLWIKYYDTIDVSLLQKNDGTPKPGFVHDGVYFNHFNLVATDISFFTYLDDSLRDTLKQRILVKIPRFGSELYVILSKTKRGSSLCFFIGDSSNYLKKTYNVTTGFLVSYDSGIKLVQTNNIDQDNWEKISSAQSIQKIKERLKELIE